MTIYFQLKKESSDKKITMNAFALVVFLLLFLTSSLVHADHIATYSTNAEQQECYICHQGLDNPPKVAQINLPFVTGYGQHVCDAIQVNFKLNFFVLPQLRAPPTFQ